MKSLKETIGHVVLVVGCLALGWFLESRVEKFNYNLGLAKGHAEMKTWQDDWYKSHTTYLPATETATRIEIDGRTSEPPGDGSWVGKDCVQIVSTTWCKGWEPVVPKPVFYWGPCFKEDSLECREWSDGTIEKRPRKKKIKDCSNNCPVHDQGFYDRLIENLLSRVCF